MFTIAALLILLQTPVQLSGQTTALANEPLLTTGWYPLTFQSAFNDPADQGKAGAERWCSSTTLAPVGSFVVSLNKVLAAGIVEMRQTTDATARPFLIYGTASNQYQYVGSDSACGGLPSVVFRAGTLSSCDTGLPCQSKRVQVMIVAVFSVNLPPGSTIPAPSPAMK